jgi:hypothetical protein
VQIAGLQADDFPLSLVIMFDVSGSMLANIDMMQRGVLQIPPV